MPLQALLSQLRLGHATSAGALTTIALYAPPPTRPVPYLLLAHALTAGSMSLHEQGAVDRLRARNTARSPVLVLEGDHVLGAKQNRTVISSALLGARGETELPVACVERGRYAGISEKFDGAATVVPATVRRVVKTSVTSSLLSEHGAHARVADQRAIWDQIAVQQRRLHVASATSSLAHTYATHAGALASLSAALPYPPGATGIALALRGELVSVDVFDQPHTCQHYWPQLVEGAALDALQAPPERRAQRIEERVRELLAALARAPWREVPAVDRGRELRVALDETNASALLADGAVLHLGAAPMVLPSRSRPVRFELPAALSARYRIAERIGVGGTKEVYRAIELASDQSVAIARMPAAEPEELMREAELSRRIPGGHTVRVLETHFDEYSDGYLVMEYCNGPSLAQLGKLPVAQAGPLLLALARAVAAVHSAAVLHRDIKLENVIVCATEHGPRLKLIDFGVSMQSRNISTAVGEVPFRGTFPYMAREALLGRPLDARSDVFSFGVACYRLLTGEFPAPPRDDESAFDYLDRLRQISRHDVSKLPALPGALAAKLGQMLDASVEQRPFMPEVVEAFEQAFGHLPMIVPGAASPPARASSPTSRELQLAMRLPAAVANPEQVLVAQCQRTPLLTLEPSGHETLVRAFGADGGERWRRRVPAHLVSGLRADLDGDGIREVYLAGPEALAALTADGELRYVRARPELAPHDWTSANAVLAPGRPRPTLIAVAVDRNTRLVLDGHVFEPRYGRDLGRITHTYAGGGRELAVATDPSGMSFNGFASQGFCGSRGTGAAIMHPPGRHRFQVAQLEAVGPRVQLAVYGPGGYRLHTLPVSSCEVPTGDLVAIQNSSALPLLTDAHAPLALLGEGESAVVLVPLISPASQLPSVIVAFSLPSGRELWRARVSAGEARAMLADIDGDGRPELVVGTGEELWVYEPWSGATSWQRTCRGLPVAFGDVFGQGQASLVTASSEGVNIYHGPACRPYATLWSGARGDLWRTGTMHAAGSLLGPS